MEIQKRSTVVNRLTGEVGEVLSLHTYHRDEIGADGKPVSADVRVVSVRFTNESRWVVKECLDLLVNK